VLLELTQSGSQVRCPLVNLPLPSPSLVMTRQQDEHEKAVAQAAAIMTALKVGKLSGSANWRSWQLAIQEAATLCQWDDALYRAPRLNESVNYETTMAIYAWLRSTCIAEVKEHIVHAQSPYQAYQILRLTFGPESAEGKRYAAEQARIKALATPGQ